MPPPGLFGCPFIVSDENIEWRLSFPGPQLHAYVENRSPAKCL